MSSAKPNVSPPLASASGDADVLSGTPLVSAVIPTYNRGHVVERAVASALAQTCKPIGITIVDDGSTDDTSARIAWLAVPTLRYYRSATNIGASGARNPGISHARGELLAFPDVDDE